jgi:outer membrane protein assembly factor BamD (BamD/ComL family)
MGAMQGEAAQAAAQAKRLYEQGLEKRRQGDLGGARNDFRKAAELDKSLREAKVAVDMLDDILRFGNTEQHNV